jgi:putative addiction module killer protein
VEPISRTVKYYLLAADPKSPFHRWLIKIEGEARAAVRTRLRRIEAQGNYGDCEPVGGGVFELKIHKGPGYRIYFGIDGDAVIVLCGGDKSSQASDIKKAKERWSDYNA